MRFHLDLLQHMLRIKVVYELRRLGLNAYSFVDLIELLLLLSMLSYLFTNIHQTLAKSIPLLGSC